MDASEILFNKNRALVGGAVFVSWVSNVTFKGGFNFKVTFINNNGEAFSVYRNSTITFTAT